MSSNRNTFSYRKMLTSVSHHIEEPTYKIKCNPANNREIKKMKMRRDNSISALPEIRQSLCPELGSVFTNRFDGKIESSLGLDKVLQGPGEELWSSPSQQLLGNLKLTRRHHRALTHQSILEYGEKCMGKVEEEISYKFTEVLDKKLKVIENEYSVKLTNQIKQTKAEERENFLKRVAMMESRLKEKYMNQINNLECLMKQEAEKRISDTMNMVLKCINESLKQYLNVKEQMLSQQFNFQLQWANAESFESYERKIRAESKQLIEKYEALLKQKEEQITDLVELGKKVGKLEREVQIEGIQNDISNVRKGKIGKENTLNLLSEDNESEEEKVSIKLDVEDLSEELKECKEENMKLNLKVKSWQCLTKELVKQFQKFISFALETQPEESQYLLSIKELFDKVERDTQMALERTIKPKVELEETTAAEQEIESVASVESVCSKDTIIEIITTLIRSAIPSETIDQVLLDSGTKNVKGVISEILKKAVPSLEPLGEVDEESVKGDNEEYIISKRQGFVDKRIASTIRILKQYPQLMTFVLKA